MNKKAVGTVAGTILFLFGCTVDKPDTDKAVYSGQVASPEFVNYLTETPHTEFYGELKRRSPEDFATIAARLENAIAGATNLTEARRESAEIGIDFRKKLAPNAHRAPDFLIRNVLIAHLNIMKKLRDDFPACNKFVTEGMAGLPIRYLVRLEPENDALAAATIVALLEGRDRPVNRPAPTIEDAGPVTDLWMSRASDAQILAVADQDTTRRELCEGNIGLFETLIEAEGESAARARAFYFSEISLS